MRQIFPVTVGVYKQVGQLAGAVLFSELEAYFTRISGHTFSNILKGGVYSIKRPGNCDVFLFGNFFQTECRFPGQIPFKLGLSILISLPAYSLRSCVNCQVLNVYRSLKYIEGLLI